MPEITPEITSSEPDDLITKANDADHKVATLDLDRIKSLSFVIDDIPYHATHARRDGESYICIQAVLGYLPYSHESRAKRQILQEIISSTILLTRVRFGIDLHGRIFAAGNFTTDTLSAPNFIFYPLSRFFQEAKPIIELIGAYL